MLNLKKYTKVINNKIVKITASNGRYEFMNGGKVIHSLAVICTNKDRLIAHWEGLIANLSPYCEKALIAIEAAKNRPNWGRDAARKFAQKRGVSPRLYRIALQCEATKTLEV